MINRILMFLLVLLPVSEVLAKQDYTYVKSSLAFPWTMFFVFFALISIPFILVIVLAWKKSGTADDGEVDTTQEQSSSPAAKQPKRWFNRIVLPVILVGVAVFSVLLVLNAYEAMALMESSGLAAPTMLNPRPE